LSFQLISIKFVPTIYFFTVYLNSFGNSVNAMTTARYHSLNLNHYIGDAAISNIALNTSHIAVFVIINLKQSMTCYISMH